MEPGAHRRDGANNFDVEGSPVEVEDVADGNGQYCHRERASSTDVHQLPAIHHLRSNDLVTR